MTKAKTKVRTKETVRRAIDRTPSSSVADVFAQVSVRSLIGSSTPIEYRDSYLQSDPEWMQAWLEAWSEKGQELLSLSIAQAKAEDEFDGGECPECGA